MVVPKIEDYKTPWEVKGEDYDPEKGKKFIHWLLGKIDASDAAVKNVEKERDEFKAKVDEFNRKDESEADRRTREAKEMQDRLDANEKQSRDLKELRLDVATDIEGITAKQAKFIAARLTGTTREEIEADAKSFVAEYLPKPTEQNDDEPEGPRRQPVSRLSTHGDPNQGSARELSFEDAMAQIPRNGF